MYLICIKSFLSSTHLFAIIKIHWIVDINKNKVNKLSWSSSVEAVESRVTTWSVEGIGLGMKI